MLGGWIGRQVGRWSKGASAFNSGRYLSTKRSIGRRVGVLLLLVQDCMEQREEEGRGLVVGVFIPIGRWDVSGVLLHCMEALAFSGYTHDWDSKWME